MFFTYTPCFPLTPPVLLLIVVHQYLVFSNRTRVFHLDHVFSTIPRVFHQTPCFAPDPVFSTGSHVFHLDPVFSTRPRVFQLLRDPVPQARNDSFDCSCLDGC